MDTKGAVIGGLLGGGAGAVIGGSGMLSKKKVPTFDPTVANALANQGLQSENQFTSNYMTGSKQGTDTLRKDVSTAEQSAQDQSRSAATDYLSNYDPITSRIVQNRQDQLKRSTFGAIPEAVQAAREAGAAGGGLDRGVTQNALAQIPLQQAAQYNEGVANLQNTAMQGQLDARSKVFDTQNQLILNKLGIDSQTAESILNSGNQALVNQLNTLIDSSRNAIGIKLNADAAAQGSNIGAITNENNNRTAVINGLLGVGGAVAGGFAGGPVGAAAGYQLGSRVVPTSNNASAGKSA